ncbi:IS1380 family transposase [Streptomyces griseoincarnatus]
MRVAEVLVPAPVGGTFQVKQPIGSYPHVLVRDEGRAVVSQAGSVLLVETVHKTGLDQAMSAALAPWRKPRAVHDPGKILVDLAVSVALGGDCLADIAMLRAEPAVFGPVASDPTASRLVDILATAGKEALTAIRSARSEVRQRAWTLVGNRAPNTGGQVIVDLDGVLVVSHSDKQDAAPTWKKTYGHHPLMGFVDHGPGGTGEPVAALLRPGNAGSDTAADHIEATRLALTQLPKKYRRGRQTRIRCDSAGGTHEFVGWLARRGRWLSYSVGMVLTGALHQRVLKIPASAWTPALETGGEVRDGAWVAELTGDILQGWPKGMRLIVRKERPHPGAQLSVPVSRMTLGRACTPISEGAHLPSGASAPTLIAPPEWWRTKERGACFRHGRQPCRDERAAGRSASRQPLSAAVVSLLGHAAHRSLLQAARRPHALAELTALHGVPIPAGAGQTEYC